MTPWRCLIHWCFHIPLPAERAAAAQGGWQTHGRRRGSLPPARTRSKYVSVILLARRGRTGAGWEGFRQGPVQPGVRTWDPSPTQTVQESQGGLLLSEDAVHLWEGNRSLGISGTRVPWRQLSFWVVPAQPHSREESVLWLSMNRVKPIPHTWASGMGVEACDATERPSTLKRKALKTWILHQPTTHWPGTLISRDLSTHDPPCAL